MSEKRRLWLIVPAVVLGLCLLGSFLTQGVMGNLQFPKDRQGADGHSGDVVDQLPWQTAQALSPLAVSTEEQAFAHEALRVADHEVDQAFAMALRQANTENRTLTGRALEISQKVMALQAVVKGDQVSVDALAGNAKTRNPGPDDDDLDIAKAQLALDKDELTDTENNLALVSGDRRGKIQEELAAHEAGMKKYDEHTDSSQTALVSSNRYQTLAGRLKAFFDQRSRENLIEQAKVEADRDTASLTAQYGTLQTKAAATQAGNARVPALLVPQAAAGSASQAPTSNAPLPVAPLSDTPASRARPNRLVMLRKMEMQRNILDILNERIEGEHELSATYSKWLAQVRLQHRIIVHLLLQ